MVVSVFEQLVEARKDIQLSRFLTGASDMETA